MRGAAALAALPSAGAILAAGAIAAARPDTQTAATIAAAGCSDGNLRPDFSDGNLEPDFSDGISKLYG